MKSRVWASCAVVLPGIVQDMANPSTPNVDAAKLKTGTEVEGPRAEEVNNLSNIYAAM